jgi:hypothetical protein
MLIRGIFTTPTTDARTVILIYARICSGSFERSALLYKQAPSTWPEHQGDKSDWAIFYHLAASGQQTWHTPQKKELSCN